MSEPLLPYLTDMKDDTTLRNFLPTPQYGNVFCSQKFLRLLVKRANACYVILKKNICEMDNKDDVRTLFRILDTEAAICFLRVYEHLYHAWHIRQ
jgi:hypothetical protein